MAPSRLTQPSWGIGVPDPAPSFVTRQIARLHAGNGGAQRNAAQAVAADARAARARQDAATALRRTQSQ